MFKSSENLRLAAEMRALQRVAAPWREARTTWFDGSPDSIAARIAATDRVLTFARSGYTPAHIGLEREAAAARAELVAARDRLLTDPIDDTARRTASQDEMLDCPHCGTASDVLDFTVQGGHCPVCGHYHYDGDLARHYGSRRTADETTGFGDLGPGYEHFGDDDFSEYDDYLRRHDYHTDPHALEHRLRPGYDDDDPARYSALRVAAIDFAAAQEDGVTDRDELAFRAARHIDSRTGQWPQAAAAQARAAFVAAVLREAAPIDEACDGCGAEAGEKCRPWCTGEAKHRDEKKTKKSHRTAATLPDFDDQLLFDNS